MCGVRGAQGSQVCPSSMLGVFQIYNFQSSVTVCTKGWIPTASLQRRNESDSLPNQFETPLGN